MLGCASQQDIKSLQLTLGHELREAVTDGGFPGRIRSTQLPLFAQNIHGLILLPLKKAQLFNHWV